MSEFEGLVGGEGLPKASLEARVATMASLVQDIEEGRIDQGRAAAAVDIIRTLASDAEEKMREAVAWQIVNSRLLTKEVADKLARDVLSVSLPIIRHSQFISDDLLIEILKQGDPGKQEAIAEREGITERVADAIVDTENLKAIIKLLRNETAQISEPTLDRTLDMFGEEVEVVDAVAHRQALPGAIVQRLLSIAGREVRDLLVERYQLSEGIVRSIMRQGAESATLSLLRTLGANRAVIEQVVRQLYRDDMLTPAFMFRALCAGEYEVFITALAVKSRAPSSEVGRMLADGRVSEVKTALEIALVPRNMQAAFRTALAVARKHGLLISRGGSDFSLEEYQAEVMSELMDAYGKEDDPQINDLLVQTFHGKDENVIASAMQRAGIMLPPARSVHIPKD
jgi:uncharacterized protein (DUF2336 family)